MERHGEKQDGLGVKMIPKSGYSYVLAGFRKTQTTEMATVKKKLMGPADLDTEGKGVVSHRDLGKKPGVGESLG